MSSERRAQGAFWLAFLFLTPLPVAGDWLLTRDGAKLETQGAWKVDGETILFKNVKGHLMSLRAADVDLEASHRATKMALAPRAPVRPKEAPRKVLRITDADIPKAEENAQAATLEASEPKAEPKVILYSTSWCGYCRLARKQLKKLGVSYVEKDIEKSAEARGEHAAKAGPRAGVPVLDIDGRILRGYSEASIRHLVLALQKKEAETAKAAQEAEGASEDQGGAR